MFGLIFLIVAAFVMSFFGVRGISYLAHRHDILDIPNARSSHSQSVPRGGGIAIAVLTLAGLWLYAGLDPQAPRSSLLSYTIGAGLIVAISWLDDLRSQPNWLRFAIHTVGAALAMFGFGYLHPGLILNLSPVINSAVGIVVTFLWIVGLTNAYNFMDGIDGIAGGQAIVSGLCWSLVGWLNFQPVIIVLGLLLAASSLGFLIHNWHPASIFMGDVGSAFLGFTLAVLPLMFVSQRAVEHLHWAAFAVVLPLWPFIFDSTFTFLRRLFMGENVFAAHRSHLYQRLVIAGYGHQFVSLLYCALAVVGSLLALGCLRVPGFFLAVLALMPLLCLSLWSFVIRSEHKITRQLPSRRPTYADPM